MNESWNELDAALRELRARHQQVEAPPMLEVRLRAAAAQRPNPLRSIAPIAAAVVIGVLLWRVAGKRPAEPMPTSASQSEFMAVPGSEAFPPPMATSILRIDLPLDELRRYGLDVPLAAPGSQVVQADFIVGDDGLARAFRFAGRRVQ